MTLHSSSTGALLLLAAVACGSDSGSTSTTTATQISIQSGNNQVAAAGTALTPLQVLLRDASDAPVEGVTVNWALGTGGGSVSSATSTSGVDGIASITRTLGPNAGTQTTTATRSGLTGSPITFSATATIQGATQIALAAPSGNSQTDTVLATLATPYAVLVRDHTNAPKAGVTVTWSALAGGITATSVTDAAGVATASRTLGVTAGAQTAQAAVVGLAGSPVVFTATANAGNPAVLLKTSGDGGTGNVNSMVTYTATVQDGHGNPRSGQSVDWAVGSGGGSITPPSNTTAANGQASATRTLSGTAGSHTATAIAPNNLPTPDTVTFTTTATVLPPATVSVGNNFFNPTAVTIGVGGSVTWNWPGSGSNIHNVTFQTAGAPANIPNATTGSFARTFNTLGTFQYECTNHVGMTGSVTVQ